MGTREGERLLRRCAGGQPPTTATRSGRPGAEEMEVQPGQRHEEALGGEDGNGEINVSARWGGEGYSVAA
jgi:hypothetical protein